MKKKNYLSIFLVLVFVGLLSCDKKNDDLDDGPCATAWTVQVQAEVNAWSAAAQKYGTNPTPANCNAYKAAGQAYLDALEPYRDCSILTGVQRTQWEDAIANARQSINSLNCN